MPACGNKRCRLPECLNGTPRPKYGRAHRNLVLDCWPNGAWIAAIESAGGTK